MREIRLYMFQCGVLKQHWHDLMLNQRLGEPVEVPVPWYLITHPDGYSLVDGGNAAVCAIDARRHWGDDVVDRFAPEMTQDQACLEQLSALGVDPTQIRYIIQSHLHFDHTGAVSAIGAFPNATVLATRAEHEYAHAPDWFSSSAYVRDDFADGSIPWCLLDARDDGYDVYNDGAVRLWQTPGHSPGHQSVEVTLTGAGSVLLAVDAVPTLEHWRERSLLGFTTSQLDAVRSIRRLHRIAARSRSTIVPGHDPDAWPAFDQAPQYYE